MCVLISGLGGVILLVIVNPLPMLAIPDPILPLREDDIEGDVVAVHCWRGDGVAVHCFYSSSSRAFGCFGWHYCAPVTDCSKSPSSSVPGKRDIR